MNIRTDALTLTMDRWQTMELVDAAGTVAAVKSGSLWITMENDRRDIVLNPGDSFIVDRNGRTLLHAEAPAAFALSEARVPQPGFCQRLRLRWQVLMRDLGDGALGGRVPYY